MVKAAKAYRLVQQASKPPTEGQADANALLESFEEKMENGLPDEALRLASTAVDLFFKYGDKSGESRALSCVAQAITSGATLPKSEGTGAFSTSEFGSFAMQDSSRVLESRELELGNDCVLDVPEDTGSSLTFTDFTELPISYGERLILETCMKARQRPYDRHRMEHLAQPRRRGGSALSWGVPHRDGAGAIGERSSAPIGAPPGSSSGGVSVDPYSSGSVRPCTSSQEPRLNTTQEAQLVSRLCQPKRRKAASKPPGEQIILGSQELRSTGKLKKGGFEIASIVARLAAPRAARVLSPTPGERVVLMWNRSENLRKPDLQRINELAKSSRRGGTARAWGVYYDLPDLSQSLADAPASARPWTAADAPQASTSPPAPRPPDTARESRPPPHRQRDAGLGDEGGPSHEPALPPLDSAPDSPLVSPTRRPAPYDNQLPDSDPSHTLQDMGHTWHHPWKPSVRSGIDHRA